MKRAAAALVIAVAVSTAFVAGVAMTVPPDRMTAPPDRMAPELTVHGSKPRFLWTHGGRRGTRYEHPVAWIRATVSGFTVTLFLDEDDVKQIVGRAKAGACDDVCPKDDDAR